MLRRLAITSIPILVIIALPLLLKQESVTDNPDAEQLVIVSPHNEAIRHEFETGFRKYYQERFGEDVDIDWRTPGGTSEIVHYIRGSYTAAFKAHWTQTLKKDWNRDVQNAFMNRKLRQEEATQAEWEARQAFLEGAVGIGVDMMFGGGQYDFGHLASQGVLVPSGSRQRHPELFSGDPPLISDGLSGEIWCDKEDRYCGACLSSFGICYSPDRLRELGYGKRDRPADIPRRWSDLADPRLFAEIGVADPSKSGSITKCFEMLIQEEMATVANEFSAKTGSAGPAQQEAVGEGWDRAMLLIKKIGGNARFFTFSAGKVPLSVAHGEVAAGMCIDFYGRSQAEWEERHVGRPVMVYVPPVGGSSVSADPIGIFRGAPHRETAEAFLDYVLSKEGQCLWNYRPGTPGGPETYALRRLPIRRDCYTQEDRQHMSDPEAMPFELADNFTYHPAWTGPLFSLSRILVRVMIIDCHDELRKAWRTILDAGGPQVATNAMVEFQALPFSYADARAVAGKLRQAEQRVQICREWTLFFKEHYRNAERLAQAQIADVNTP